MIIFIMMMTFKKIKRRQINIITNIDTENNIANDDDDINNTDNGNDMLIIIMIMMMILSSLSLLQLTLSLPLF